MPNAHHNALRAAALAASLAALQAIAQEGGTQLYGTFNVDLESVLARGAAPRSTLPAGALGVEATGIDVPRRTRVTQNSSNVGFRGNERLNADATAFWQVESAVPVDAGNGTFASRNSAVGLRTTWGSLFLGQWDTPYKAISGAVDPWYFTGIADSGALIGTPGFGVSPVTIATPATSSDGRTFRAGANASFERRQGNSIQYWSPAFAGANLRLAYSVDEAKNGSPGSIRVDPYIISASVDYQPGIFYVAYGYELHHDYFGLDALAPASEATPVAGAIDASTRDRGDKLVARVKLGRTILGFLGERLRYRKQSQSALPGAFSVYARDAFVLTLQQGVGVSGTIRALAGRARAGRCERSDGSPCDASGLGARQVSVGYSYAASRRTELYALITRTANEERAAYQLANGAGVGAAAGARSVGHAIGIRHTF